MKETKNIKGKDSLGTPSYIQAKRDSDILSLDKYYD